MLGRQNRERKRGEREREREGEGGRGRRNKGAGTTGGMVCRGESDRGRGREENDGKIER